MYMKDIFFLVTLHNNVELFYAYYLKTGQPISFFTKKCVSDTSSDKEKNKQTNKRVIFLFVSTGENKERKLGSN